MGLWNAWKNFRAKARVAFVWDIIQVLFYTLIITDLIAYLVLAQSTLRNLYVVGGVVGGVGLEPPIV